jgi:hypothetical protein
MEEKQNNHYKNPNFKTLQGRKKGIKGSHYLMNLCTMEKRPSKTLSIYTMPHNRKFFQ